MIFEIQKTLGRTWKFIVCFILLNAVICIWSTREDPRLIPNDSIQEFFSLYAENYDQMDEEYKAGVSKSPFDSKYAPEDFSDYHLFNEVYYRIEHIDNFENKLNSIIINAQKLSLSSAGYLSKYYENVINKYTYVKDNSFLGLEYTRGWSSYFNYRAGDLLLFVLIIIISSITFIQEKSSGFLPIIRTTRFGRTKTGMQKIASSMIVVVVLFLVFTVETWILFFFRIGFSSTKNAIQIFEAYELCPYVLTVGEFFIMSIVVRAIIFTVFAAFVMMISVYFYNYVMTFLFSIVFIGVNYFMYLSRYIFPDNIFSNINLFSAVSVTQIFSRYRAVNLFGIPIDHVHLSFVLIIILFVISLFVTVKRYNQNTDVILKNLQAYILNIYKEYKYDFENFTYNIKKIYLDSLFSAENYKTFFSSKLIIVVSILLIFKLLISSTIYQSPTSYADTVYKEYMEAVAGEVTNEKRNYLFEERTYIDKTLAAYDTMQENYINEIISEEEYHEYLTEYNYAYSRNSYLKKVEDHLIYIDELALEGKEAWFIYDTGWKKLLIQEFDWTLYLSMLLLFSGVFASEYNSTSSIGGFADLLRTTKYGRNKTFINKFLSSISASVLLTIVWNCIDIIIIFVSYDMPLSGAPVHSIRALSDISINLTLLEYLLFVLIIRVTISILFSVFISSLSQILKKHIIVLAVTILVTMMPELLVYFGMTECDILNFVSLTEVTPILLSNIPIVVYIIAGISISTILTYYAERAWDK